MKLSMARKTGIPKRKPNKSVRRPKINSPGDFIRFNREVMNYTKAEIGRHLGIPGNASQYLGNVETDRQLIGLKFIYPLCRMLRVSSLQLRVLCAEHEMIKIRDKYGIKKRPIVYMESED